MTNIFWVEKSPCRNGSLCVKNIGYALVFDRDYGGGTDEIDHFIADGSPDSHAGTG